MPGVVASIFSVFGFGGAESTSKPWANGSHDGDEEVALFNMDKASTDPNEKRICVPQKIDPKTFFANERTFLKWLTMSVMLGLMAVSLLNFTRDAASDGAELAGIILLPVSILFMVYALAVFRFRAHCIYMREPMRYDDTRGPTILVVVLAVSLLLSAVFSIQRAYQKQMPL